MSVSTLVEDAGRLLPSTPGYALGYDEETYHRGLVATMPNGESNGGTPTWMCEESLSYSGAKGLLPPWTPAHFRGRSRRESKAFDFGHAAHLNVLGVGAPVQVIPTTGWLTVDGKPAVNYALTKGYREAKAEAEARGLTVITEQDQAQIDQMMDRILAHDAAAELLTGEGEPEVSMWAPDPLVGCWLRGRIDFWNQRQGVLVDYKTVDAGTLPKANPDLAGATVWKFHYELQAAWYLTLAELVGIDVVDFQFVMQEKTPPFAVSAIRLDDASLEVGREEMRQVITTWAHCQETGLWPAYPQGVETVSIRRYAFPSTVAPGVVDKELDAELRAFATLMEGDSDEH